MWGGEESFAAVHHHSVEEGVTLSGPPPRGGVGVDPAGEYRVVKKAADDRYFAVPGCRGELRLPFGLVGLQVCAGDRAEVDLAVARSNECEDASEDVGVGSVQAVAGVGLLPGCLEEVCVDVSKRVRVPVVIDQKRSFVGNIFLVKEFNDLSPIELNMMWEWERTYALRPVDSDDADEDSLRVPRFCWNSSENQQRR